MALQASVATASEGDWFFRRPKRAGRPSDLGYFISYRIVESYYLISRDKAAAVKDILAVTDHQAFSPRERLPPVLRVTKT